MTKNVLVFAAAFTLLTAGRAAAKDSKPDWVKGTSREYSRDRYLTGVGMGDKREIAQERARGEISKVFTAEVTVKSHIAESETNVGKGGKTENAFAQAVSQTVETASKMALEGVEVVENWQDAAARLHYALAVLEREKAIAAVKDKIEDLDKQAEEWKNQMDAATAKLAKIKAAMKLLTVLKARDQLNAQHRVLDPGGKSIPGSFNAAEVKTAANKAITQLEVYVDFQCSMKGEQGQSVGEPCGDEVETGIIKGLNDFGFEAQTAATSSEVDIIVQGKAATAPLKGDRSDWRWARTTVTVSLKDGHTSKTITRFDAVDRQASSDYDEAARRSRVSLSKKVAASVNEATVSYFENQ